ncbi:Malic acid transport protein [Psilocybe cubensis]|uniref:Malic acid transport protein n=2 Tax=Psilocybe cubensis TaxID=181762 RepID=A0ACB8GYK9_PSICU|nr:Malic acid transport protein [Psilocybe cubensis]KAH9480669.1 Malic acid transport protein [Psilocybe cubensis]
MASTQSTSDSATLDETPLFSDPERSRRVGVFGRRIHGWSWQSFPIGMGTSAVYLVFSGIKDRPIALHRIEVGFFFMNMALFILNTLTLILQAILYPKRAWRSFTDPVASIFVPLIVLSFATIVIGTVNYAVPLGHVSLNFTYALFWLYVAFSLITSFVMLMIWFNHSHELTAFTPGYAFLIFPLMLTGVVAASVLTVLDLDDRRCLGVLLTGYFFQGLGFFMTFFYICIYIIRLIMTGFLEGHQANSAFIVCGPPGFTALALINLGKEAQFLLPHNNLVSSGAGDIWYASSVLCSVLLFGLAVFFFIFGALPYGFKVYKRLGLKDILSCWAVTFPNVGWIATLRLLGDIFDIAGFHTLHKVLAIALLAVWTLLFILTITAFVTGRIFISTEQDVMKDKQRLRRRSRSETSARLNSQEKPNNSAV